VFPDPKSPDDDLAGRKTKISSGIYVIDWLSLENYLKEWLLSKERA